MVALSYSIGIGRRVWLPRMNKGFRQPNVLKLHPAGKFDAAALGFGSWTGTAGKLIAALYGVALPMPRRTARIIPRSRA